MARAGLCLSLSLLVLAGVVAATLKVGAAFLGSLVQRLAGPLSFWASIATLVGELLWLMLTGRSTLCLIRILESASTFDLY